MPAASNFLYFRAYYVVLHCAPFHHFPNGRNPGNPVQPTARRAAINPNLPDYAAALTVCKKRNPSGLRPDSARRMLPFGDITVLIDSQS